MLRRLALQALVALTVGTVGGGTAVGADADGDGIWDEHEELLGTDPQLSDRFYPVLEDGSEGAGRDRKTYDPTKDVLLVEFCHAGGNRYLWRVTLAAPPRLDDTVLHLYVDADADETTGRKVHPGAANHGTDYMLSVVGGQSRSTRYTPEGGTAPVPPVTCAVQDNQVIVSADIELRHDADGIRYDLYVLCHTLSEAGRPPSMSDATGKHPVRGIPVCARPKIMRPADYTENYRVQATFGLDLVRRVLRSNQTLVVPHDQLETDGFQIDLSTTRRWPHVSRQRTGGRVWTHAPQAGRYHVGFMMYDDSRDERVALYIDGVFQGVAVAGQDNNRTWLYWLDEPHEFRGGERVELRAIGAQGKHGIINVLFLPQPPEVRPVVYRVENLVSHCDVGRPGRVVISWTTTWPCPTRLEYGLEMGYGNVVEHQAPCLVHRVVLEGLDPEATYHGRAVGTARDGSPFYSEDFTFTAAAPPEPETVAGVRRVPLVVRNPHPFPLRNWPITTGIPLPQGQLGSADHVRLVHNDREVPLQVATLARWPDRSIKWLLLTFQAVVEADGEAQYQMEFGRQVRRAAVTNGLAVRQAADGTVVDTGAIQLRIDPAGNLAVLTGQGKPLTKPGSTCTTVATDAEGSLWHIRGAGAQVEVEESGPVRAVVKTVSPLVDPTGVERMQIEQRIEAYRGCPFLRIRHTLIVTGSDKFTELRALAYRIPLAVKAESWQAPLAGGDTVELTSEVPAVRQQFDNQFVLLGSHGETVREGRLAGHLVARGQLGCAVALRDFWQNYPKGFAVDSGVVQIALCPAFPEGLYDEFPFEQEGHHLYYYLLGGRYRLKQGMAKTHDLFLCFAPEGGQLCAALERPPLATAPPAWYCQSRAFYEVAPRDSERFRLYEDGIDRNLEAYVAARRRQGDFGMLNYGDWYGERGSNWGNVEYDTQHAFFLEYIRSGNPAAFWLAEVTELHNRDIDTIQWSRDPGQIGAVYVHQMCHVGEYYDRGVPGTLGYPRGGFTVSHAWVEGHFEHYFLTGDRRSFQTGCAVADFFIRRQLGRPYDFSTCRTPGWHLIMLAAAYHATGDPYYLNAAKVVVQRVLQTQETQPRPLPAYQAAGRQPYQLGGWSRMMVPGHCRCVPRHRGNAGFMVAILLSGLKYYHEITGEQRVKEAIIRGAHYLLDETYSDQVHGFRYTSCPKTSYSPGATPLMVEGIARAYLWTRDERFRRVLTEALPLRAGGSAYGKGFSMYYRAGPRVLADLEAAELRLDRAPERGR